MFEKTPKYQVHLLTWLGFGLVLFGIIAGIFGLRVAAIRVPVLMLCMAMTFYVNLEFLLPIYFAERKNWQFLLLNLLLIILVSAIGFFLTGLILKLDLLDFPPIPGEMGNRPRPPHLRPGEGPPIAVKSMVRISTFLNYGAPGILGLFFSLFYFNSEERVLREKLDLEAKKAENEFLVSQINPHFLFNALNTIYALSLDNPKSSKAILQLSDMLNYSLYQGQEKYVRLQDEIDYISNYIAMYKLREAGMDNIDFDHSQANPSFRIAPLLIIPFVENAFKHGNVQEIKDAWIRIRIVTEGNKMFFSCENTCSAYEQSKDQKGGIGVVNVKRRLELVYKGKYSLKIKEEKLLYRVELELRSHET